MRLRRVHGRMCVLSTCLCDDVIAESLIAAIQQDIDSGKALLSDPAGRLAALKEHAAFAAARK